MRAIQYSQFGGYDQLRPTEVPDPTPRDGEALIQISLAGVSPLDNTIRAGHFPRAKAFPITPGVDGVGRVVQPGASGLKEGQRVLVFGGGFGTVRDGTWSELVTAAPGHLIAIPDPLASDAVAALSTGAGYLTAYLALTELAGFKAGQTVLSPGIGGAVGAGSVEVAKALGASLAISTASRTDKAERGRAAGHEVIDLSRESLRDGVRRLTGGRGVDVVLDGVAGGFTGQALASLAPHGTLVSIGYADSVQAQINVTDLIWRTAHIHGFMFSLFSGDTVGNAIRTLFGLLAEGALTPVIAQTFPLERAAEAQRHLIEDRPYGRVVLSLD
jgi:NADPH2:quinone reductase